jgi:virulence-associated protein VapD
MKLSTLIDNRFHTALNKLSQQTLPLRTVFKLKGISKVVRDEYAKYEEVRQEALKKHGLKNEDGSLQLNETNNVKFDDAGMKAFAAEIQELTAMDVTLPSVKVSELGDINITLSEVELLDGVIVED